MMKKFHGLIEQCKQDAKAIHNLSSAVTSFSVLCEYFSKAISSQDNDKNAAA